MKRFGFALFYVLLFAFITHAQGYGKATLKVNSIGVNSTAAEVKRVFGKPLKETAPIENECGGGFLKDIKYKNIKFLVIGDTRKGVYRVLDIEIKGSGIATSKGIRIGSTLEQVKAKYGKTKTTVEGTEKRLDYNSSVGDGSVSFIFKKNKLVRIHLFTMLC